MSQRSTVLAPCLIVSQLAAAAQSPPGREVHETYCSKQLPELELAWAIGLRKTTSLRSSPVIVGSTMFYAPAQSSKPRLMPSMLLLAFRPKAKIR